MEWKWKIVEEAELPNISRTYENTKYYSPTKRI